MNITYFSVGDLGTNCYIVSSDDGQAVIIDPAADSVKILQYVKGNNLTVVAVLLTHAHFDHILAVEDICRATDAPLCVGAADASMLANPKCNLSAYFTTVEPVALTADRLLHEGDTIAVGNESLTVMETAGHTMGSVCYIGDGVLFSGDTLFAGSIGRTDLPDGDMTALRASLARLAALDGDYTVYAGHGETTTLLYEKQANPYLASL